ncbi:MAG: DUF1579 domain-containing protein [Acidobacteria bacterium]|nr:DUF1579 domain-containing protein [Acidobacteriota bacterium]
MNVYRSARFAAAVVVLSAVPLAAVQSGGQMPPMPKPGPEHEMLKLDEGTWDAIVEFIPGPGAPPMTSKGVEVNTIGCSGLCLISDFKGEAMGAPFQGHGVLTWDAAKKKYIGSWTDSMSMGLALTESSYDPAAKKWTGSMEGPDMTGKVMKMRSVLEYTGTGTRVMTSFGRGPDGKEMQMLKISYKKR